jgi:hypothetical protein
MSAEEESSELLGCHVTRELLADDATPAPDARSLGSIGVVGSRRVDFERWRGLLC